MSDDADKPDKASTLIVVYAAIEQQILDQIQQGNTIDGDLVSALAQLDIAVSLHVLRAALDDIKHGLLATFTPIAAMFTTQASNQAADDSEPGGVEEVTADSLCTCMHLDRAHLDAIGPCKTDKCPCVLFVHMTPKITPERLAELQREGTQLWSDILRTAQAADDAVADAVEDAVADADVGVFDVVGGDEET